MYYYELERSETWQTWPPENNLQEFLQDGGRGLMFTQLTITSVTKQISLMTKDTSSLIDDAYTSLTDAMDKLQSHLISYNSSTVISDDFVLYENSTCDLRPNSITLSSSLARRRPASKLARELVR